MAKIAGKLGRRAARRYPAIATLGLPCLWFVTDPARTPDPATVIAGLPRGAGVIYRSFGAPDALNQARRLRRLTRRRGLILLIGADARLARRCGADGVHLPERRAHQAGRLGRAHPRWLVTAAAHHQPAILAARRQGVQAILLSAVFPSHSPSAGPPLGPVRFQALARGAGCPVIALGGVNRRTARRLAGGDAAGLAAVDGFRT